MPKPPELSPFLDPSFNRASVYFDDIQFQRRFEQNLIRYGVLAGAAGEATITTIVNQAASANAGIGFVNGAAACYWIKDGTSVYYDEGYVGVGKVPETWFNVQGLARFEADPEDTDGDCFIEIVSQKEIVG